MKLRKRGETENLGLKHSTVNAEITSGVGESARELEAGLASHLLEQLMNEDAECSEEK